MSKLDEFLGKVLYIENNVEQQHTYLDKTNREIEDKIVKEMVSTDHPKMTVEEQSSFLKSSLRKAYGPHGNLKLHNSCSRKLKFLREYRKDPKKAKDEMMKLAYD